MKRLFLVSALAVSTMLGSCATTPTSINSIITEVEQVCNGLCAFVPDVATIEAIVSANNPALATVQAIATAICSVVANIPPPKMSAMLRGAVPPPTIAGVVIHGTFTKGALAGRSL